MPSNKTFHITNSGPIDHSSGSPSVAMSVHPSPLSSITQTTFPSDAPSEKPMMLVM